MRFLGLAGLAGACLAVSPLYAADLFESAPPPMDAPSFQSELGSNWYIRGDVGYGQITQATVVPNSGLFPTIGNMPIGDASNALSPLRGNNKTVMSPDFNLGFGYRINDWFRIEADWTVSQGPGLGVGKLVYCPEATSAVPPGAATGTGYAYDYTTCDGKLNMTQYNNTGLVMGYVDLGHWSIFTPFIGAGAGLNANTVNGSLNFTQTADGSNYAGVTSVQGSAPAIWMQQDGSGNWVPLNKGTNQSGQPQPIGPGNWSRKIEATKYTFAAAAAAGLGIKISQSATLDLAYKIMTYDITGGIKSTRQSATIGVRYDIN